MLDHRCCRHSFKAPIFDLSLPCRVFLFILFLQSHYYSTIVRAEANITVDDGDSRITYSPPGAWTKSAQTQLDYGGSHMLTQNPTGTAIFNFTGTAIYFISPLWPYNVTTAISLDSSPPSLIDLVDHSKPNENQGAESVPYSIVWGAANLRNTQHVVRISVGAGETYAIVDALMYTDPSANSAASAASPTGRVVADPSYATSSPSSQPKSLASIVVGVLFGLLGVLLLLAAIWYIWRRKRRTASEPWATEPSGSEHAGANGTGHGVIPGYANGQGYGPNYGPPSTYSYGPQSQPLPYPPYAYGSYSVPHAAYANTVPPNRAPNRYQPGYTLSTITEKSTPQMPDGTRTMPGTPMSGAAAAGGIPLGAYSPASMQSELGYYTAPNSSVGQYSPPVVAGQVAELQTQLQPQQQRRMGITQMQESVAGSGSGYRK